MGSRWGATTNEVRTRRFPGPRSPPEGPRRGRASDGRECWRGIPQWWLRPEAAPRHREALRQLCSTPEVNGVVDTNDASVGAATSQSSRGTRGHDHGARRLYTVPHPSRRPPRSQWAGPTRPGWTVAHSCLRPGQGPVVAGPPRSSDGSPAGRVGSRRHARCQVAPARASSPRRRQRSGRVRAMPGRRVANRALLLGPRAGMVKCPVEELRLGRTDQAAICAILRARTCRSRAIEQAVRCARSDRFWLTDFSERTAERHSRAEGTGARSTACQGR